FINRLKKFVFVSIDGRSNHAFNAFGRRWFNLAFTKLQIGLFLNMIKFVIIIKNMPFQPITDGFCILNRRFPKSEKISYLSTMISNGSPVPIIVGIQRLFHINLFGYVLNNGGWNIIFVIRKTGFILKNFNKDANPSLVSPDLFPIRFISFGKNVKCSSNSSISHFCFTIIPPKKVPIMTGVGTIC